MLWDRPPACPNRVFARTEAKSSGKKRFLTTLLVSSGLYFILIGQVKKHNVGRDGSQGRHGPMEVRRHMGQA